MADDFSRAQAVHDRRWHDRAAFYGEDEPDAEEDDTTCPECSDPLDDDLECMTCASSYEATRNDIIGNM